MFGLTFEKLFLVVAIAAILLGPRRLPLVAQRMAELIRALRTFVDLARDRVESDLGVPVNAEHWRALDPRQYDPRRILADALQPVSSTAASTSVSAVDPAAGMAAAAADGALTPSASRANPVGGSSGHPRKPAPPSEILSAGTATAQLLGDVTLTVTTHDDGAQIFDASRIGS
jgi:Sec-independent protein translocase protein TatA